MSTFDVKVFPSLFTLRDNDVVWNVVAENETYEEVTLRLALIVVGVACDDLEDEVNDGNEEDEVDDDNVVNEVDDDDGDNEESNEVSDNSDGNDDWLEAEEMEADLELELELKLELLVASLLM